jgi:hypothetical protein
MAKAATIVPSERIAARILFIRGHRVMLDSDLAEVYGTSTKALNQAVKRNRGRFPADFMFQLSPREKAEVVTNCDHLRKLKYSARLPFAFTEHGAVVIASVLNSSVAVQAALLSFALSSAYANSWPRTRNWLASWPNSRTASKSTMKKSPPFSKLSGA